MTDVSVTDYTYPDTGRKEQRISLLASITSQLEHKDFLVPLPRTGDDYDFLVVPEHEVATHARRHKWWDGKDGLHDAFRIGKKNRLELAPGSIELPVGEYEAVASGRQLALQRVYEAKTFSTVGRVCELGIGLDLNTAMLEYLGWEVGDKFYAHKERVGSTQVWTPGSSRGDGGSWTVRNPFRLNFGYRALGCVPHSDDDFEVEVLIQRGDDWRLEFNFANFYPKETVDA